MTDQEIGCEIWGLIRHHGPNKRATKQELYNFKFVKNKLRLINLQISWFWVRKMSDELCDEVVG